ncbi:MAG: hypothetical protein ABI548_25795 [Polyangiaceae bacterium]
MKAWVILAPFVGGELFGVMGTLLALPSAAVATNFVTRGKRRCRESERICGRAQKSSACRMGMRWRAP